MKWYDFLEMVEDMHVERDDDGLVDEEDLEMRDDLFKEEET